ncbi:PREDICTED: MICOS complex subunit MIC26 [Nanorana parkeri]|uniref:MICOS complex subunit MIC26 n=1 Tax=Nanorana parkeri TaxID=125878 RepID=UPI00085509BB|nr:PREDICTED: MICOS complex subunit MIC26 [Nanorana parkeri]
MRPSFLLQPGLTSAVMLKAVKLAALPASLGFAAFHVHAESETKTSPKRVVKLEELSLYSTPVQEARFVEEKPTELEEGISWLRQSAAPYTSWCQDVYTKGKPKVETAVDHSKVTYAYLKDAPPGFYPRLGLIGFAGIVGLFLARGSRIKKIIYPLGFMGIGASLYYPQRAATIAKGTSTVLYDWSLQGLVTLESLWKDGGKKKSGKKEEKPTPSVNSSQLSTEEATKLESSSESSK